MLIEKVRKLSPLHRLSYWMSEREAIRRKRKAGEPAPWTDDLILQSFRFTNVRRMDDAVSQWLWNSWYLPHINHPYMLPAVTIARFFNLPFTLGWIAPLVFRRDNPPDLWGIGEALRSLKKAGHNIFNAAYVIAWTGGVDKISSVLDYTVKSLLDDPPAIDLSSMQCTHSSLLPYQGFGSFMAGQVVADLRWALAGEWGDRWCWAPIGPGSARGMNRLHGRDPKAPLTQEQFLCELQQMKEDLVPLLQRSLTCRIEAMDYQNCLCEISGYEKVLWGQGKKKQRYNGGPV